MIALYLSEGAGHVPAELFRVLPLGSVVTEQEKALPSQACGPRPGCLSAWEDPSPHAVQ